MIEIDNRTIIDPSAKIAADVTIGPWTLIGPGVEIKSGTKIGSHVVIKKFTKIGHNNQIHDFAALGGDPQDIHYHDEETHLEIGDDNIIREFCTINRGTSRGGGITRIGNKNFFMTYAHVAHDCTVGNEVVLANNASLAGHVRVDDYAIFGAFCGVHQFVTIGAYSFLGRATKVGQDIPPYVLVTGNPGGPKGLNLIGLKRRGFSDNTVRNLRRAYSIVYRQGLKLTEAVEKLEAMVSECPELAIFVEALKNTKRGVARK